MSGKSTYLRQIALITILAQAGSFVPAATARIGLTDQVFTRIGASDDITGGQSTFMVEMTEVADIFAAATENSLVLLDEVGRGTSTADGFAIACAVSQYIHEHVESHTLFATHHHELTDYISEFEHAFNLHFDAEQRDDEVVFYYNVKNGPATASYGINVAREAGLPTQTIETAKAILSQRDDHTSGVQAGESSRHIEAADEIQSESRTLAPEVRSVLDEYPLTTVAETIRRLEAVDLNDTRPIEALNLLHEMQQDLTQE